MANAAVSIISTSLFELQPALLSLSVANGDADGLALADQVDKVFGPRVRQA